MRSGMMPVIYSAEMRMETAANSRLHSEQDVQASFVTCGYLAFLEGATNLKHEKENHLPEWLCWQWNLIFVNAYKRSVHHPLFCTVSLSVSILYNYTSK